MTARDPPGGQSFLLPTRVPHRQHARPMKPIHLLPPLVAVGIVSLWLTHQRSTLSALEKTLTHQNPPRSSAPPTREAPLNWHQLHTLSSERLPTLFDKQLILRAHARIRAMTEAELLAALDEVSTLTADVRELDDLREKLIAALQEKNPEAALDYLNHPDRKKELHLSDASPRILAAWAASDPAAAAAWFDRRIAAGDFDTTSLQGHNFRRNRIEAAFLGVLLKSNPADVETRVLTLPDDQRFATLQQMVTQADYNDQSLPKETHASFTSLIRSTLLPNAQAQLIAETASTILKYHDYQAADAFLDQASASPAERESAVQQAARGKFQHLARKDQLTSAEIDKFRTWATSHAPDKVDQITGRNIASASYNGDSAFRRAVDLAFHYQQQGHEEVLVSFLGSASGGANSKARLLEIAEKIQDPASREKAVGRINGNPYLAP